MYDISDNGKKTLTDVGQGIYDLIIIGAASSGLSAAIYAGRKKLKTIILAEKVGGQSLMTGAIENYPGFKKISGSELIQKMREQVVGARILEGYRVVKVEKQGGVFNVSTKDDKVFQSKSLLITSGKTPKLLNIPGESEFEKKGVTFCSTCDAPLYGGKDVVVVGGGNAGLDATMDLTKYANKIYVLEFSDKLLGDELTQEKLETNKKVNFILNAQAIEIKGSDFVEELIYEDRKTSKQHALEVSGVFVSIGSIPSTNFIKDIITLNDKKEIIIDLKTNATNIPGIFAAGDVTNIPFKQCVIAAGEGAKAALNIYSYLQKVKK